jgi:RNA polymerase sigma-70 factor (ECF subfamily)
MTLMEAFSSWERLQVHPKQEAWLFTVARQRYAKVYKDHLRHGDLTDPALLEDVCQDDTTARSDRRLDLLATLRRHLSEQQREALILRHLLDLPYAEIAEVIGVRPSSARALVSRALARLSDLQAKENNEEGGCT